MTGRKGPSAELGPPHFMIRVALIGLLVLPLAGCGGGDKPTPSPCPRMLAGAATRVVAHDDPQLLTCAYATTSERLHVTFDDLPQAWFRYNRALVERTQTTVEWAKTPAQQPKEVLHVGAGAFWVPATRELVTSDGRRLLTVKVLAPTKQRAARALATQVAPHGLGPNHVPVATGP